MANRLADETSPYLLQHKDNPVDWYPWGPEALERAQREDKPTPPLPQKRNTRGACPPGAPGAPGRARGEKRPFLVSIGSSACHWCHVMERESFEDEQTAADMNASLVCIKVDREERPDVD